MEKKKRKILIYLTAFTILASSITYKLSKEKKDGLIQEIDEYLDSFQDDDFLICAHRAYQDGAIENTKEAIICANENAFIDYIEIDVRLTKDNQLVLSHDDILLNKNQDSINISSSILKFLLEEEYSYQSFSMMKKSLSDEEKTYLREKRRKLINKTYQLTSLLEGLKNNKKKVFLDLKYQNNEKEFNEALVNTLRGMDLSNIILQSNNRNGLIQIRQDLNINTCLIIDSKSDLKYENDFDYLCIRKSLITYPLIEYFLNNGKTLAIWTINDSKDLNNSFSKTKDYYKDIIYITDYPDLIATKLYQKEITKF